jgi:hypothetical protein
VGFSAGSGTAVSPCRTMVLPIEAHTAHRGMSWMCDVVMSGVHLGDDDDCFLGMHAKPHNLEALLSFWMLVP